MNRRSLNVATTAALLVALTAHAAALRAVVKDRQGRRLADAVVVAVPADPRNMRGKSPADAIDQVDKQFVPYVKPIYVGSRVRFPNKDNIRHQVYSFSAAKKFELPLYAGTSAQPVQFDNPGVVVLGCNIHDWMIGYIYVSDSPFFAKTDARGTALIEDLPPGEYLVRIWQPGMVEPEASTVKRVNLGGEAVVDIEWQIAVKPSFLVPRVSGGEASAYP